MNWNQEQNAYTFRPYRPYRILGILGVISAIVFCVAGISYLDQRDVNANATTFLLVGSCFAGLTIFSFLGYRICVTIMPNKITIRNNGRQQSIEKSLDSFTTVYFVRGPQAYQKMVLTKAPHDPAAIRKIAFRKTMVGLWLYIGEQIVTPVWPKDIEIIREMVGDRIQIVDL